MNFLKVECQEPPMDCESFGLCDDRNGLKAYVNTDTPSKWIATVKNNKKAVVFTAIDKCVIKDHEYEDRGRCDEMLTWPEHLYFVELKDEKAGWIEHAVRQLESTIQFFIESHDIKNYKHKKVFACNKKHKHFREIDNELNLAFFRKYKFRIDVQAEIIII